MQQATLAQSVEQRIRNAQVVSSSLMSGSKKREIQTGFPFFLIFLFTQVLDHAVVEMAEKEDLTVGAETEGGIVNFETGLGLVNDEAYAGETFLTALLDAVEHKQVADTVSRTGIFKGHATEFRENGHAVEVKLAWEALRLCARHSGISFIFA